MTPSVMICFSKSSSLFCQCHPMLVSSHFLPVAPINVRGHIGVQLSSTMAVLVYLTYSETSLRLIETVFWWPFWKQRHDKYFWLSFSVNCEDPYGWNFSRWIFSPKVVTYFSTSSAVFEYFWHWATSLNWFFWSMTSARVRNTNFFNHLNLLYSII